jgi:hypothetical protein
MEQGTKWNRQTTVNEHKDKKECQLADKQNGTEGNKRQGMKWNRQTTLN